MSAQAKHRRQRVEAGLQTLESCLKNQRTDVNLEILPRKVRPLPFSLKQIVRHNQNDVLVHWP